MKPHKQSSTHMLNKCSNLIGHEHVLIHEGGVKSNILLEVPTDNIQSFLQPKDNKGWTFADLSTIVGC